MAQMKGVLVDDDCGEQVESGNPVVLALGGPAPGFTPIPGQFSCLDAPSDARTFYRVDE